MSDLVMVVPNAKYREIDGQQYVLVDYAIEHVEGASGDAVKILIAFVMAYRPDDTDLHEAMRGLLR